MIANKKVHAHENLEGSMNGPLKRSMENYLKANRMPYRRIGSLILGILILAVTGCGRSDPSGSAVVPPPTPTQTDVGQSSSQETTDSKPPGGMELPDVTIPTPDDGGSATRSPGIEMPSDAAVPSDSGASIPVNVEYGTWDEIREFVSTNGRITVVDFWSLSCEPCLKEFPGLVRLHTTLGSTVQCVAVDMDYDGRKSRPPEHYEERVAAFLKGVGASGFPTYISRTPSDDLYAATKLDSIPAVIIYDADGQVAKVFVDAGDTIGFTYEKDVIPFVKRLAG